MSTNHSGTNTKKQRKPRKLRKPSRLSLTKKASVKSFADFLLVNSQEQNLKSAFLSVLARLNRKDSEEVPLMAVSINFGLYELLVGPKVEEIIEDIKSHPQLGVIFKHELLHISQGHLTFILSQYQLAKETDTLKLFRRIANIAADYADNVAGIHYNIFTENEFLSSYPFRVDEEGDFVLDEKGRKIGMYRGILPDDIGLPRMHEGEGGNLTPLGIQDYWTLLENIDQDIPPKGWATLPPEEREQKMKAAKAMLDRLSQEPSSTHLTDLLKDLSPEDLAELISTAQVQSENIGKQLNREIRNRGFGGSDYSKLLGELYKTRTKNWEDILRDFCNDARVLLEEKGTRCYYKVNNALINVYEEMTEEVGLPPGKKQEKTLVILAVMDTSGSVSDKEIMMFYNELLRIQQDQTEILLLFCDWELQGEPIYVGQKDKLEIVRKGHGGTQFDPPFKFLLEQEREVDGVLYFTDGEAPLPRGELLIADPPVLWCITPGGSIPGTGWNGSKPQPGGMHPIDAAPGHQYIQLEY